MLIASSLSLAQGIVLLIYFCSGCLMSNTVTIFCLVQGQSSAFPIRISKSLFVADLKKEIKKEKPNYFRDFDADSLELWKVDIPSHDAAAIQQLVLEENEARGVHLLDPTFEIEDYFSSPARRYIHVVVKRSASKCTFTYLFFFIATPTHLSVGLLNMYLDTLVSGKKRAWDEGMFFVL